jgi:cytochrome P450
MMMAAHDTTASALTTMVWAMTEHPEWQDRLLAEVSALPDGPMTPEIADQMPLTEMVFKEA